MTRPPLHLLFDGGENTTAPGVEMSPGADGIHIHLHVGAIDRPENKPVATTEEQVAEVLRRVEAEAIRLVQAREQRRSERKPWRSLTFGIVGVAVAMVVALDLAARMGEGHASALAVSRASASGLASLIPGLQRPPAPSSSSELPASVRQQLAQRPTITPPLPAGQQPAGGSNPFGLHP